MRAWTPLGSEFACPGVRSSGLARRTSTAPSTHLEAPMKAAPPPRRRRLLVRTIAGILTGCMIAAVPVMDGVSSTAAAPFTGPPPSCGRPHDPGWTLATTTFDTAYTRHAYVGNGYLGERVPPTGMGYVATGEKSGWPLYTPRYDGSFVAGLY